MRQKIQQFMMGRYGNDQLGRFLNVLVLVLLVLSMFSRFRILYWIALGVMIYTFWRMLSRNISRRYEENQKYLVYQNQVKAYFAKIKNRWAMRNTYRFFKCPSCKQTVRVPKGKGKICITCPKCRTEFVKKS